MATRRLTSRNRVNSAHYVVNHVHYARNGIYEIKLAEFPADRILNSDESLERLARAMQREAFIVEYYPSLAHNPNKEKQCAKVLKAWYDAKERVIRGMVQLEGHYARHLDQLIRYSGELTLAIRGKYTVGGINSKERNTLTYTEITGFRLMIPNVRSW